MFNKVLVVALALSSSVFGLAPLKFEAQGSQPVKGGYIVVLRDNVKNVDAHVTRVKKVVDDHNAKLVSAQSADKSEIKHVYQAALRGYAGKFSDDVLAKIRADPEVDYVEQDGVVKIKDQQDGAPWGLGRISSHSSVSDPATYFYNGIAGTGVKIFVVDTGIRVTHQEFGGRAVWGANFAGDGDDSDGNGHGTHVSGTAAGSTYGVSKNANLVAVKVLDAGGSGTWSGVVAGINWVASEHKAGRGGSKGSVISMSLGGGKSTTVNTAASNAVKAGVHVAVAAGNESQDACNVSPASASGVLCMAASDVSDTFADFSNYGRCVKMIGPGVDVLSSWNTDDTATNTISGTSMSTPHASGMIAYLLSLSSSSLTPAAMITKIQSTATNNAISSVPSGTPNKLLYNSFN
ncbi:subtilisin-like protein [Ramicandelaber brevisporus]|nr:subtilisin-like protein [Ramicandelaber brevisporus]